MSTQTEELADIVVAAVRAATSNLLAKQADLEAKILLLEARAAVPGPTGPKGEPGERGQAGQHGEAGPSGPAGKDAPAVDLDDLALRASQLIPKPKDGTDGIKGDPGEPGIDGKDAPAVDVDDIVRRAVALVPVPKDGAPGPAGPAGVGVAGAVIDKDGSLVVTLSDGSLHVLGKVVGSDGAKGEKGDNGVDGRDGTLEDATFKQLDARSGHFVRASDGSLLGHVTLSAQEYCGVFVAGKTYQKGDHVTRAGSLWVAREMTKETPGDGATSWQLAAKCGAKGDPGKVGDRGPQGLKGDRGDAGRNFS